MAAVALLLLLLMMLVMHHRLSSSSRVSLSPSHCVCRVGGRMREEEEGGRQRGAAAAASELQIEKTIRKATVNSIDGRTIAAALACMHDARDASLTRGMHSRRW